MQSPSYQYIGSDKLRFGYKLFYLQTSAQLIGALTSSLVLNCNNTVSGYDPVLSIPQVAKNYKRVQLVLDAYAMLIIDNAGIIYNLSAVLHSFGSIANPGNGIIVDGVTSPASFSNLTRIMEFSTAPSIIDMSDMDMAWAVDAATNTLSFPIPATPTHRGQIAIQATILADNGTN